MSIRYLIRPLAQRDLDAQALYFATQASHDLGRRFLLACHETFSLLASNPRMGWLPKFRNPKLKSVRVFRVNGFEKILVLYRPGDSSLEILRVVHGSRNLQALLKSTGL